MDVWRRDVVDPPFLRCEPLSDIISPRWHAWWRAQRCLDDAGCGCLFVSLTKTGESEEEGVSPHTSYYCARWRRWEANCCCQHRCLHLLAGLQVDGSSPLSPRPSPCTLQPPHPLIHTLMHTHHHRSPPFLLRSI
jgi:hypothetical protein